MTRPAHESLDYDTWLQQRAALTDELPVCGPCRKSAHFICEGYEFCSCEECFSDDNVPDEADTDPDYD